MAIVAAKISVDAAQNSLRQGKIKPGRSLNDVLNSNPITRSVAVAALEQLQSRAEAVGGESDDSSESSGAETDSVSGSDAVNNIIEGATPGRKTKGKTTQFDKPGGAEAADRDFDSLDASNVREVDGGGRVGMLEDGSTAIVRPTSQAGKPTVEIQTGKKKIKIRYSD